MPEPRSRPPAVAGTFYPGDAPSVARAAETLLAPAAKGPSTAASESAGPPRSPGPARGAGRGRGDVRALVLPHAGWVYSGSAAAAALRSVPDWSAIRRIFLLGPSHHYGFSGLALSPHPLWTWPGGQTSTDLGLAEAWAARARPGSAGFDARAHAPEHALEVELPLLAAAGWRGLLVPVLYSQTDPHRALELWAPDLGDGDLVIVSSDLSHFHRAEEARRRDQSFLSAVLAGDLQGAAQGEACGLSPWLSLMALARSAGWRPGLADYRTSADAGASPDRVVGYAGVVYED